MTILNFENIEGYQHGGEGRCSQELYRPMQRQVWEGVEIREVSCDILLNSKQDHYVPVVGRMEERREAVQRARV